MDNLIMPDTEISLMNQRLELVNLVPKGAQRILDVGCATGDVGLSIKKRFRCEVVGIEIDTHKAETASRRIDQVIAGDAETINLQSMDNYFDCIIFADVLEHLRHPAEAVRKYSRYLKKDGLFIISIPNVRHIKILFDLIFLADWKYEPSGIMDEGHLRFFTLKSFLRLMRQAEIVPISVSRIFSLKGSKAFNLITLGIFRNFLTAQYIFLAKKRNLG